MTPTDFTDDPALERFAQIPRGLIAPSALNPRKTWNAERVREIAASMRQLGQLQPIRVRPMPDWREGSGRPQWEIVVGETRWRASEAAELPTLDCIVRDYTDVEAREAPEPPLAVLDGVIRHMHMDLTRETAEMVWRAFGWDLDDPVIQYEGGLNARLGYWLMRELNGPRGGRALADILLAVWLAWAVDLQGSWGFSPHELQTDADLAPLVDMAKRHHVDTDALWGEALREAKASLQTPTEAFLAQHAEQASPATSTEESAA